MSISLLKFKINEVMGAKWANLFDIEVEELQEIISILAEALGKIASKDCYSCDKHTYKDCQTCIYNFDEQELAQETLKKVSK